MNYFLIDYENIGGNITEVTSEVKEGDVVFLFYSEHCKNIAIDIINAFTQKKANIVYEKVTAGTPNALDFQLSSCLGCLIGMHKLLPEDDSITYFIMSNDKGYDCLLKFWEKSNININKLESKNSYNIESKKTKEIYDYISTIVAPQDQKEIKDGLKQSDTIQKFHNIIQKHYKNSRKAGNIYCQLKPALENYYNTAE